MSKSLDLAKVSVRSGFNLFWGALIVTIISSIEIIVLARLLSPANYGVYTIALVTPNLIKTFRDLGIDQSLIRYTAKYNADQQKDEMKTTLAAATTFEIVVGFILSLIVFFLSEPIGNYFFNRPEIVFLIQIASIIVLAEALLNLAHSAFIGCEKMHYYSLLLVLDAVLKVALIPLFLILGLSTFGAVAGFTLASVLVGIIAILLFYKQLYRKMNEQKTTVKLVLKKIKDMLRYGLPLSAASILDSLLLRFYSMLIVLYVSDAILGNYQVAGNFSVLLGSLFLTPLRTCLFPAFSKINSFTEPGTLRVVFQSSIKYASLIVIPVTFALMALAEPAIFTIFGSAYASTPFYLMLFVLSYLFTAIGYYNTDNLIKSQGKTTITLAFTILKLAIGIVLGLTLIPSFGIIGLMASSSLSVLSMLLVSLYWIKKSYNITVLWIYSSKILISSLFAAIPTYIIATLQLFPNWITLIMGATIYLMTYIVLISLIGAIDRRDTQNLKEITKSLGPLSPLFSKPLIIIDSIITRFD
jgi:stage V sporulation protein B